jgi:uncharacterized repeat protein (TIGR01451 family)
MTIKLKKALQLIAIIMMGIFMVATVVGFARNSTPAALALGPIPPPDGYPKLSLSTKAVTPTLANTDGAILTYNLEILNTGAYTAADVTLLDVIPANTTYNNDARSSAPPEPVLKNGAIAWEHGVVGFDTSVLITFSVTVVPGYEGIISNTAIVTDPMIVEPVSIMVETRVTDSPLFEVAKTAFPELPGKEKPLTYELVVTNQGQAAVDTPITVTEFLPADTTFLGAGPDGTYDPIDNVVNWQRSVNLAFGETSTFTFSVTVGDVASGTVIENKNYLVFGAGEFGIGEPYTTTVIDPIFILSKSIFPDPPGSNREMTYTLTVLNLGSMATDLVITDTVPSDVEYVRGGDDFSNGIVTWHLPSLDTRESAQVTFTVYIGDIADIIVLNGDYGVCSAEDVCAPGLPVSSLIVGPTFEATATLDPIAKGTGGGTKPVTPTLMVHNLGPGNALDATALLTFGCISISNKGDLQVIPNVGTLSEGPDCGEHCWQYVWIGNMDVGDTITFTTYEGQSTIGGEQGTHYTATVVITDDLSGYVTEPVTGTAIGEITHFANLIPSKSAPATIGPGQVMTYSIQVFDSAFTTEMEPLPVLTETVPASLTVQNISDDGTYDEENNRISWTLPAMGPGDYLYRSFSVLVDEDLVSGTLIINDDYRTTWYEQEMSGTMSNLGEPVTTTVREVGLIDSYKTVTPTWALPGTGTALTYVVHVVNSGPYELSGVQLSDIFPWENSTYQRDAQATSGSLISDIVSLEWTGDVAPYSETLITFTAVVDDFFKGVLTNTANITHTSLKQDVVAEAVAYITDEPVLRITKVATPDPVLSGNPLLYQIEVTNLGQQATLLVITDTVPANTSYIFGSASSGGLLVGNQVRWNLPVLNPGETLKVSFQVRVEGGRYIVNDSYAVRCDEGVFAYGEPVVTPVWFKMYNVHLPLTLRD